MNKVIQIGNACRDAEVKTVGQSKVANFTIAVNRQWKDANGNEQKETTFTKVEYWGALAEKVVGPYVKKGTKLCVEGRLKLNSWNDNAGKKCYEHLIVGETVELLGRPDTSSSGDQNRDTQEQKPEQGPKGAAIQEGFQGSPAPVPDDIPF